MDESCQRPYSDDRREEQARARAEYNRPVPPTRKYSEELAPDDPPDILTDRLKEYMETLKSFRSDAMQLSHSNHPHNQAVGQTRLLSIELALNAFRTQFPEIK